MLINGLKREAKRIMTRGQVAAVKGCLERLGLRRPGLEHVWRGMEIPELHASHVAAARLYANRIDALDILPRGGVVAEIGVALGDFSQALLDRLSPRRFDAFDIFRLHEDEAVWDRPSAEVFGGLSHRSYYERRFDTLISAGRVRVFEGDGAEQISLQPNFSYDVIYIDADHSYEAVSRDADAAERKLKKDGILVFNDYTMMDHWNNSPYGVVPVVNDFCINRGWKIVYLALNPQMFCDIAIRRVDAPDSVVVDGAVVADSVR